MSQTLGGGSDKKVKYILINPRTLKDRNTSGDGTVKVWDVDKNNDSFYLALRNFTAWPITSDFHPSKDDLICALLISIEIRVVQQSPNNGSMLVAAAEKVVSIIVIETQVSAEELKLLYHVQLKDCLSILPHLELYFTFLILIRKEKAFNNTRVKHRVKRSIKVPTISNRLADMMIIHGGNMAKSQSRVLHTQDFNCIFVELSYTIESEEEGSSGAEEFWLFFQTMYIEELKEEGELQSGEEGNSGVIVSNLEKSILVLSGSGSKGAAPKLGAQRTNRTLSTGM
ncbi:transcriptional corepressor LEUNIG_HOMOLOG-like isoform X2 [Cucumis melo var. makuwa]|uniref:Transcriptional corepressor LEUNIG_HOMOLOG-like isoform X2 n=1 Tax=Cucumis melo var. makuwa TaxID=1194695 RepID=A0A5A7TLF6_CUCMM|nr:transcriptional corepressor LEUNIG_HOMOLOG-like isoform X2 [Cucumis melo var. makuwa]